MADFTIKPASGTGNKLILQTQAETDVLTTSDSGVTLASATLDAPTIADLSNVTGTLPVGVTGGSGLTELGTVTSANLANSAIVYPAGHVLQVVKASYYISAEVAISTGNYYDFATLSITPKSSSSTLIYLSNPRFYSRSQDRASAAYSNTYIYIDEIGGSAHKMAEWINYSDTSGISDGLRLQYPTWFFFDNTATTQRQFRTRAYSNAPTGGYGRVGGEYQYTQFIIEVE